jgi:hypothetical protein
MMPGKRDVKTFIINGQKVKTNVRILQAPVKEVFGIFKEENPTVKIGLTTFSSMIPKNVKHFNKMPYFSCKCRYHENYRFTFNALKPFLTDKTIVTYKDLIDKIVCSNVDYDCMSGSCVICKDVQKRLSDEMLIEDPEQIIQHKIWRQEENKYNDEIVSRSLQSVFDHYVDISAEFKIHSYVNKIHQNRFERDRLEFKPDTAILVVDFSEKFNNQKQNEIQAYFFGRESFMLFTAGLFVPNLVSEKMECIPFAIISNASKQDKFTVYTFIETILKEMKEQYPHVTQLRIWSDGAASQFKSIFTMSTMFLFGWILTLVVSWIFFVTSHGKSLVDGIGATVKEAVARRVRTGEVTINSVEDFYKAAHAACPNMKVRYVDEEAIKKNKPTLEKLFGGLKKGNPVKSFRSYHFFQPVDDDKLRCSITCLLDDEVLVTIGKLTPPAPTV